MLSESIFLFQIEKENKVKKIKVLLIINFVLLIILMLSFIPKNKSEIFYTSLVKEHEIEDIYEIILTIPDNSFPPVFNKIKLIKNKNNFFLDTEAGKYMAEPKLIEDFFHALSLKNNFTFLSDNPKDFANFGLDENSAIKMQLIAKDKTMIGEFIFGKKDTLGSGRFVRIDSRTKIFRMPDTLSAFLTLQRDYWLDLQIYKRLFVYDKIQSVEKKAKHIIRKSENDMAFEEFELFLKQFSCIDIFPAEHIESIESESFSIFLGNGEKIKIEISPMDSGDYILYDSKNKNSYVISAYTKKRIFEALNKIFLSE